MSGVFQGPSFKSIIVFRGIGRVVVNQFEVNCCECGSTDGLTELILF